MPPSFATYLPSAAIRPYSQIVANALKAQKLPAIADYTAFRDWQVRLWITQSAGMVTPVFALIDPTGSEQGTARARPVRAEIWKRGQAETLRQAAAEAAPRIAEIYNREVAERRRIAELAARDREAAEQAAREHQEAERRRQAQLHPPPPARVFITGITGAPSDGNQALARLMHDRLTSLGEVMLSSQGGADFTVRAKIDDVAVDEKTRRLEIFWHVNDAANQEVGEIVQLKEVPAGSLDHGWGNLALDVSDEAAGAVRDVILTHRGLR